MPELYETKAMVWAGYRVEEWDSLPYDNKLDVITRWYAVTLFDSHSEDAAASAASRT